MNAVTSKQAADYQRLMKQYLFTVAHVEMLNAKQSERGNLDKRIEREAYLQTYEQRLSRVKAA